jgi:hypothetical protein
MGVGSPTLSITYWHHQKPIVDETAPQTAFSFPGLNCITPEHLFKDLFERSKLHY